MPAEFIEIVHPGQSIDAVRAMLVIVDRQGVAHAWDVDPVRTAKWDLTGLSGGRSEVQVTLTGAMHRRSKQVALNMMKDIIE